LFEKQNQMSGYFVKKPFSYAILLTYTQLIYIIYRSYVWDALHAEAFCRLYASWLTKTFRTQKSTKVWITNKIFRKHKSTKVWITHKNIPQTRKKTKVTSSYIKSVNVVSNSLGLILVSIAIQCRILFWHKKITQSNYKCWEKFIEIWF
jgi:Ca2+/Na+ antiporter